MSELNQLNDAAIAEHAKTLKLPALRREYGQYGELACQAGAKGHKSRAVGQVIHICTDSFTLSPEPIGPHAPPPLPSPDFDQEGRVDNQRDTRWTTRLTVQRIGATSR